MTAPAAPTGPAPAGPTAAAAAPAAGAPANPAGAPAAPSPGSAAAPAAPADPGAAAAAGPDSQATADTPSADGQTGGTAAAEQPGAASSRQRDVRGARGVYGGDSVAGDKFVFYLSGGQVLAPLRRLSPTLDDLARHAFVAPQGWDQHRHDFYGRRTVVLRGTAGQGRMTMAIRLLQTVEASVVYQLDPQVDLARLAERIHSQPVARGTAFLLPQPTDLGNLTGDTFQGLEAALVAADARLVVTVGDDVPLRDDDLLRYQMDLPAAPPLRDILRRHLEYLRDDGTADAILSLDAVEALVAERLDGKDAGCEVAASTAFVLSRAEEPIDVEWIRIRLHQRRADSFDVWFESLDDLELRSFAIALAVLDGLPYEDVAEAARLLHRRLVKSEVPVFAEQAEAAARRRDPFRIGGNRLESALRARTSPGTVRTRQGAAPATTVAYRDPHYPRQVLERVWQRYRIQDRLLAWLGDLVAGGSDQVRIYASTALGVLAGHAFEHLRTQVFEPWARSEEDRFRESVADAAREAACDPRLRPNVARMVNTWLVSADEPLAQATAALALGTRLGVDDPAPALATLQRLAFVEDPVVYLAIGRGLAWLLADNAEWAAAQVYDVLWRCVNDRRRSSAGQIAFLMVANEHFTEVTAADGTVVEWPSLLLLAVRYERMREPLYRLWARVLTDGPMARLAGMVLHIWAGMAEADDDMREAFTRMVRALQQENVRAGAAVRRLARGWDDDEQLLPLPRVARAVAGVVGH